MQFCVGNQQDAKPAQAVHGRGRTTVPEEFSKSSSVTRGIIVQSVAEEFPIALRQSPKLLTRY